MQVVNPSLSQFTGTAFPVAAGGFNRDFGVKVQIGDDESSKQLEMEEKEEEEFSFDCLNPDGSPISADDVFLNGKIRPVFPFSNEDLVFANGNGSVSKPEDCEVSVRAPLKKVFVEGSPETTSSSETTGPYRRIVEKTLPDTCKKSNSTGFSKLWRFKDFMIRSNSDGKDAFVFFNHTASSSGTSSVKAEKKSEKPKATIKQKSSKTTSAHEKLYVKNKAMREGEKRRSYLPYKQFGFFTNVNKLSRNLHPF
ncbi:hypothetical protein ERO13_A04G135400v2 [Gossypium hirsutum]|uniref:Uncharacterized protein n=1 Tax=Gossypium hirsutum TaxID=3635 RepID=A0A1U8M659_GOSHI|nr:uncharacterized protein LOC107933337 [Gossypium hirsutum]KAG4205978.1 hypothetical protein ERO13_A04G135400v2 [Gossypium hirsutum]